MKKRILCLFCSIVFLVSMLVQADMVDQDGSRPKWSISYAPNTRPPVGVYSGLDYTEWYLRMNPKYRGKNFNFLYVFTVWASFCFLPLFMKP